MGSADPLLSRAIRRAFAATIRQPRTTDDVNDVAQSDETTTG
jgi:hypothetical protein